METPGKRFGLKLVQESAHNSNVIVGNDRPPSLSETNLKKRRISNSNNQKKRRVSTTGFPVHDDLSNAPSSVKKARVQYEDRATNTEEEVTPLNTYCTESDLTEDEPGLEYWKTLAETRRVALEESLTENQQLHCEVNELKRKVEDLGEENSKYVELAERAEFLANTIKVLTGDGSDEKSSEETDSVDEEVPVSDENADPEENPI